MNGKELDLETVTDFYTFKITKYERACFKPHKLEHL